MTFSTCFITQTATFSHLWFWSYTLNSHFYFATTPLPCTRPTHTKHPSLFIQPSKTLTLKFLQILLEMLTVLTLFGFGHESLGTTIVRTPLSTWALIWSTFTFSGNSISLENSTLPPTLSATCKIESLFLLGMGFLFPSFGCYHQNVPIFYLNFYVLCCGKNSGRAIQ